MSSRPECARHYDLTRPIAEPAIAEHVVLGDADRCRSANSRHVVVDRLKLYLKKGIAVYLVSQEFRENDKMLSSIAS